MLKVSSFNKRTYFACFCILTNISNITYPPRVWWFFGLMFDSAFSCLIGKQYTLSSCLSHNSWLYFVSLAYLSWHPFDWLFDTPPLSLCLYGLHYVINKQFRISNFRKLSFPRCFYRVLSSWLKRGI